MVLFVLMIRHYSHEPKPTNTITHLSVLTIIKQGNKTRNAMKSRINSEDCFLC